MSFMMNLSVGQEEHRTKTHFVIAGNYGLLSTSVAAMVQVLLVLQHQNGFGQAAARAQHVDLDELVQDLEQIGVGMISIDRGLLFLLVVFRLRSQLISKELSSDAILLCLTLGR